MRAQSLAILGAVMLTASGASAQTAPAPRALETYPAVEVNAFASTLHAEGQRLPNRATPDLLRRAIALDDVRDWIAVDDPSIQMLRDTSIRGYVEIIFDIGVDGRVSDCRIQPGTPTPYSNGLCERLSSAMRFHPALDLEGRRTTDIWYMALSFWKATGPARARIVNLPPIPPTPRPDDQWPPFTAPMSTSVTGLDLLTGGGAALAASASPWAGVRMQTREGAMTCTVIKSSGDARFNTQACEATLAAQYAYRDAIPDHWRYALIHFVQQNGQPRAVLPVQNSDTPALILPDEQTAIRSAMATAGATEKIRLRLEVDARGQATQCLVTASSGVDATDVTACRLMTTGVRFTPAVDVFGRPHASSTFVDGSSISRQR